MDRQVSQLARLDGTRSAYAPCEFALPSVFSLRPSSVNVTDAMFFPLTDAT